MNELNCEIPFWKVFHNKFLLTTIINQIESSQNINKDYKKISYKDKLKFKEIVSFEWMIENKQYQLLKCKIKNTQERIDMEFLSLYKLFEIQDQTIIKEISKLLIDYRQEEISKMDLITNKPAIYKDEPTKKLLQFLIIIHTKRNTYYEIVNGLKYKGDSGSGSTKATINPIKVDLFFIFGIKKSFDKLLNDLLSQMNYCKSSFYEKPTMDQEINKILLEQKENSNKSRELHRLFAISNSETTFEWWTRECKTWFYYSWLRKYQTIIKQLSDVKSWAMVLKYSFNSFDGIVFNEMLSHTPFGAWALENEFQMTYDSIYTDYLERVDSDSEYVYKFINVYTSAANKDAFKRDEVDVRIFAFIFSLSTQKLYDKGVASVSTGNKDYENVFPKIRNQQISDCMKWGSIGYLTIENKETVDWLVGVENNRLLSPKLNYIKQCYAIKFENCFVEEYALNNKNKKSSTLDYFAAGTFLYSYEYAFVIAIFNCDLKSIQYMNDNKFGDNYQWQNMHYESLKKADYLQQIELIVPTNQQLVSFSNYLKESNYKNIIPTIAKLFYRTILTRIQDDETFDPFTCIDLEFTRREDFKPHLMTLFKDSILDFKPKQIKFFLKVFKLIDYVPGCESLSNAYSSNVSLMFTGSNGDNGDCKVEFIEKYSLSDFDECLNIFFVLLNNASTEIEQANYSQVILLLYKILVKFKDLPIETIKQYHQKIQQNQILVEIQDCIYLSFFYLVSLSKRFSNYIMDLPFLNQYFNYVQCSGFCEYSIDDDGYGYYSINTYLDPMVFSYDYLFCSGASFDDIMMKVIYHLSCKHPSPIVDNPDIADLQESGGEPNYLNKAFNYNLQFLLNIRKVDLFFQHLDYINVKLNDTSFTVGTFPTIISKKMKKSKDCCQDLPKVVGCRVFEFSKQTFELACHVLNQEQFKRFSNFCSYHSIVNQLPIKSNFKEYHILKHFETINHIQKHHK